MSKSISLEHYRLSNIGQDLRETLDELISHEMFNKEHRDVVLEQFDKAFAEELAKTKDKATVTGKIKRYRMHDDIWSLVLEKLELNMNGKAVAVSELTKIISVKKE